MPIVLMPDGVEVDMPDNPSPEQLSALQKRFGKGAGALESTARDLIGGFGKAASMAPRAVQTIAGAFGGVDAGMTPAASGTPANSRVNPLARAAGDLADSTEAYWTKFRDKSTNPRYVQAALRGVGGAAAGGAGGAAGLAAGAGGGVGEEVAASIAPGNPIASTAGGLVGGLAAGGAASLAARARPQTANLAREALEGIGEEDLRKAAAYQAQVAANGHRIDLAQALAAVSPGGAGNLESIRNTLAGSSQGNRVQASLRGQPQSLAADAELTARGLPGTNWSPAQNANNIQAAATEVLQATKQTRTKLWEDTARKGVTALRASEGVKVADAKAFADSAGVSLSAARGRVQALLADLQKAKSGDAAAVAGVNRKIEETQELLARLQQFSLPRGAVETNRGNFSTLPQRGESILNDSITREVQAANLAKSMPQQVADAPSLQTLQLENQLTAAQKAAAAAEASADGAVAALGDARVKAAATSRIPEASLAAVNTRLKRLIAASPNTVVASELSALRANLQGPDGPLTDPRQINRIFTEFTTRLKSPDLRTAGMDAGTAKHLGGEVNELRNVLGQGFKPIRDANEAYRAFTKDTYNPLKQGPVGNLAQPHGYDPATQAVISRFDGLMNKGSDPTAKVSDIATAAKELAKANPSAFQDAFKGWLSRKVQSALQTGTVESPLPSDPDLPRKLYSAIFEDPLQWQGIKDATRQMAIIQGQRPEEVIRGLENLRTLTTAMKSTPGAVGGISPQDLKRLAGSSATANTVRIASFLPANRLGENIERAVFGKTLEQFDTILTSPEGAKMLIELGKVPVMSRKAQVILGTYGGTLGNSDGLQMNNPPN